MKYLITGSAGQLGSEFISQFRCIGADYLAPAETEFNITSRASINAVVGAWRPDVIINCAAYNNVDKAQTERDRAFLGNAEGPRNLAAIATDVGAKLVHYSTDYVFDGAKKTGAYLETDVATPLNIYGESKLAGEKLVLAECPRTLVLRLSWLYGRGPQNFISKVLFWAKERDVLKIADDEVSVPTSAARVVDITLRALNGDLTGLYHAVNSGYCSRLEWADAVLKMKGIRKHIEPAKMKDFNLPARRPGFSAMENNCISDLLGISIPCWKEDLERHMTGMEKMAG